MIGKKDWEDRHHSIRRFWTELLNRANERTPLHARISPSHNCWIGTVAGKAGITFEYNISRNEGIVRLYFDKIKGKYKENKTIYEKLMTSKEEIEKNFGLPLEWVNDDEGRKSCVIMKRITIGGYANKDKWPEIQDAMIDAMISLEKAVKPHI